MNLESYNVRDFTAAKKSIAKICTATLIVIPCSYASQQAFDHMFINTKQYDSYICKPVEFT